MAQDAISQTSTTTTTTRMWRRPIEFLGADNAEDRSESLASVGLVAVVGSGTLCCLFASVLGWVACKRARRAKDDDREVVDARVPPECAAGHELKFGSPCSVADEGRLCTKNSPEAKFGSPGSVAVEWRQCGDAERGPSEADAGAGPSASWAAPKPGPDADGVHGGICATPSASKKAGRSPGSNPWEENECDSLETAEDVQTATLHFEEETGMCEMDRECAPVGMFSMPFCSAAASPCTPAGQSPLQPSRREAMDTRV